MSKINRLLSKIKVSVSHTIANTTTSVKTSIKNGVATLQESFDETKKKPISKRRAFMLGFITVTSLGGLTIFAPMLPAIAKDIPKNPAKPGGMVPTPPSTSPNMDLIKSTAKTSIATFIGGICAEAFQRGSFVLGALCGFLTVTGIFINKKEKPN